MDNLLLRFSFMDGLMTKEEILGFLSALRTETEAYLEVLEKEIKRDGPRMPFCGRAAAELGLEGYRVNARWAERIYSRLRKEPAVKGETS